MAFEGSGSKQYVAVAGQSYEVVTEGRGEGRQLLLRTPQGALTPMNFTAEGMTVENGAAAGLPASVPTGSYELRTEQDPFYVQILFLSLSLIIVGVGFLKANISTIVGALYAPDDPRRDRGFTIFYMGINLGSVLATLGCGYLGIKYGWSYGFGLAGFGMLAGLLTFLWGQKHLLGKAEPRDPAVLKQRSFMGINYEWTIYVIGILMLLPAWFLVQRDEIVIKTLSIGAPLIFAAVLLWSWIKLRGAERSRMIVAMVLIIFSVLFWTLFEQAGSSMTLYADRNSDLAIGGGVRMTAAQTNFFNPALIVLLAPVFAGFWGWLEPQESRTVDAAQVRPRHPPGGPRLPRPRGRHPVFRRPRLPRSAGLAVPRLPAPHDRRNLPVAGGPVDDHQALGAAHRRHDDGRLVPVVGAGAHAGRPDRPVDLG